MAIEAGSTTYWQSKRGIVQDGLVLNLDAGVDASYGGTGTTWTDLKGGNNGTLTNGPTFDSANGGSIVFDGTNDYVSGGDTTSSITTQATVCVWFKAVGVPSHNDTSGAMLFCQSNNFHHGMVILHSWLNKKSVFASYINQVAIITATNSIPGNSINYVVGTVDTATDMAKFYHNGVLLATNSSYTSTISAASPLYQIGRWGLTGWGRYLNGHIYGVNLYNRALSANEVAQNYNATRHRFGV